MVEMWLSMPYLRDVPVPLQLDPNEIQFVGPDSRLVMP